MSPRNSNLFRKELSVSDKIEVIHYAKNHSERATAVRFGISKTCVNCIKKNEHEIVALQKVNEEMGSNRYRKFRKTDILAINDQTWEWLEKVLKSGEPIGSKLIKQKALSFAHDAGVLNFSASNGWLESFKRRFGFALSGARSKPARVNRFEADANSSPKIQESENAYFDITSRRVWKRVLPKKGMRETMFSDRANPSSKTKYHDNTLESKVDIKEWCVSPPNKMLFCDNNRDYEDLLF